MTDGQTDGQTDRITTFETVASIAASRGKKTSNVLKVVVCKK